jgi:hypothetical protein
MTAAEDHDLPMHGGVSPICSPRLREALAVWKVVQATNRRFVEYRATRILSAFTEIGSTLPCSIGTALCIGPAVGPQLL